MQSSEAPNKISIAFARDGDKRPIPNTSQIGVVNGAASYPTGFPPLTFIKKTDGGIPPDGEDFNGVLYDITNILRWQSAGGLFKFDTTLAATIGGYPMGATLLKADGSGTWQNSVENNSSNPDTGGAGWTETTGIPQLGNYATLRSYTGKQQVVYITTPGIAGAFVRITSGNDDGGVTIRGNNGFIWGRISYGKVSAMWFGAKFDSTGGSTGTDDTAAIQACIDYAQPLQRGITLPVGIARITGQLQVAFSLLGLNMEGQGFQKTRLNYAGILPITGAAINIIGHSGNPCGAVIEGIGFDGNSTSSGVVIAGQCGQVVRNCQFGLNFFGVVFRNNAAGSFTENCRVEACDFTKDCASPGWYNVVGAGDISFHKSGFYDDCTINTPATNGYRSIIVDPTAVPYNSGMDVQIWANAVGLFIDMSDYGAGRPYFKGTITTEVLTGSINLCNAPVGKELPLVGKVAGFNQNFTMGSLFMVDAVVNNSSGSRQTIGGKFAKSQALVTGANAITGIPLCILNGAAEYIINIIGPNYNYRYLLSAFSKENGGQFPIMATYSTLNSAGWGAPTFSIDPTTGYPVITNAAYPATGVTATVEVTQLGQSVYSPFFK